MDVQRAILLFALAFVLIVLYQRWLEFQVPQTPPAGQTGAQEEAGAPAEDIPETPDAPEAPAETADTGGAPQVPQEGETAATTAPRVRVTTDLLRVEIDANGGGIEQAALLKHPVSVNRPDDPYLLLKRASTEKGDEMRRESLLTEL